MCLPLGSGLDTQLAFQAMEALLVTVLGAAASTIVQALRAWLGRKPTRVQISVGGEQLEMSGKLSGEALESLLNAMAGTGSVERQVEEATPEAIAERRAELAEVEGQLENARQQLELSQDEMRAAVQIVEAALDRRGRREFWQGLAINFAFFILGVVVSLLI